MTIYSDSLISNIAATETNIATTRGNIATTEADISKLNEVQKPRHTARQLHQRRNAIINRNQRRADNRHWNLIQKEKIPAATRLISYKEKLAAYEAQLVDYEKSLLVPVKTPLIPSPDLGVLQPMLPVLAEPITLPLLFPKRKLTRIITKRRLGQSRYGY